MLMAVSYSTASQPGLQSLYPPPLLPKPGKDNARLQKLLKKSAKKKAAVQSAQTPVPFRSSLSPVSEASPDLEHSDHSTPPKTPETPAYGGTLYPRVTVRSVYQHMPSPYPHQRSKTYSKIGRLSPQSYAPPVLAFRQASPHFTYTPPPTSATTDSTPFPSAPPQAQLPVPAPTPSSISRSATTTLSHEPQRPKTPPSKTSAPTKECSVPQTLVTEITSKVLTPKTPADVMGPTEMAEIPKTAEPVAEEAPTPYETERVKTPTYGIKSPKTPPPEPPKAKTPTLEMERAKTPTKTPTEDASAAEVSTNNESPRDARKDEDKALTVDAAHVKEDVPTQKVPTKEETAAAPPTAEQEARVDDSLPKAQPLLKAMKKPQGLKSKLSGWSRLKKHMVVETEQPKFPEPEAKAEDSQEQESQPKPEEAPSEASVQSDGQESAKSKATPRATKMWDAVLFQMFSTEENILQQINNNEKEAEKPEVVKGTAKDIPAFVHRLPLLLYSPRFDARKLKEAASRPLTKIATVFEMALLNRKNQDDEPKDFNRVARGFVTKTMDE
ncbi:hypothetical protein SKAU_G00347090 [Synaphobranchus kaupii]|uniref:Uncharacterized protein n=1 Tax=Synaphobranchus kaupii TaxID=118154 RepID=A0A9Q1EJN2_SYNKA|nr:hypothetical protein SKAU_G00347090 [Synaphobranchus kaupii]